MKPLIFTYSHDQIFTGVKIESSYLAERKQDGNGDGLFDALVFDEEYLVKFRELFLDAQSRVCLALSAYMKDIPEQPDYFQQEDFHDDKDFTIGLIMPNGFLSAMSKPIDITIKEFLIAYIMYRWLETKLPQEAAIYFDRAQSAMDNVKRMLLNRNTPLRVKDQYY